MMEYVEGPNLAEVTRGRPLGARVAARYLKLIAEAIHLAHQNKIIHRDLKPSNILLDLHDQPRVTDFGLARRLESDSSLTISGQALGSLPYVSPEQARGLRREVGIATDVYSLGATLYHLLTGRPPFVGEAAEVILRQVLDVNPVPPQKLNPSIPTDLNTICLKCLEKTSVHRYGSSKDLADDLGRFLSDEPVKARPVGPHERVWRWCRKRPAVAVMAASLLGLVAASATLGIITLRTKKAEAQAKAKSASFEAEAESAREDAKLRQFLLDRQYSQLTQQLAGWFLRLSNSVTLLAKTRAETEVRDQMAAALAGMDGTLVRRLDGIENEAFVPGPPGPKVLVLGKSPAATPSQSAHRLKIWDQRTEQAELFPLRGVGPVAWLSNSIPLQLVSNPTNGLSIYLWNLAHGYIWREFLVTSPTSIDAWTQMSQRASRVLSPDGAWVAVTQLLTDKDGILCAWETASKRQLLATNFPYAGNVNTMAFSPDGALLAAGLNEGFIVVWSIADGRQWRPLYDNGAQIRSLTFHREQRNNITDGHTNRWLMAAGDASGVITIWDLEMLHPRIRFVARSGDSVDFSPDGTVVATGGRGNVQLWDMVTGRQLLQIPAGEEQAGVMFSDDGSRLFVAGTDGGDNISLWDLEKGRGVWTLRGLRSQITEVCFSGDGRRLAAFSKSHEVAVWNLADKRLVRTWEVPHELRSREAALALNQDGTQLAFASDRIVKWWVVGSGQTRNERRIPAGIGNTLAFAGPDALLLFRQENSQPGVVPYPEADPKDYPRLCRLYALSPQAPAQAVLEMTNFNYVAYSIKGSGDGRYFVVDGPCVSDGQTNRVLTCFDGLLRRQLWSRSLGPGHPDGSELRIDSEGQVVVATDDSSAVGIRIDLKTGSRLPGTVDPYPLALGPGGTNWVAWNRSTGRGLSLFFGQTSIPQVTLGIDAPSGKDATFRPLASSPPPETRYPVFSPDGDLLAWGQTDGSVQLFDLPEIRRRLSLLHIGW